jgi:hypothetical protein
MLTIGGQAAILLKNDNSWMAASIDFIRFTSLKLCMLHHAALRKSSITCSAFPSVFNTGDSFWVTTIEMLVRLL